MEELFGLSTDTIMKALLAVFAAAMAVVVVLALRNRIMLKLGLRPIPRRPGQSVLIVVGVMLSTVIMAAAFGTGDTISFSIRNDVLTSLATIDEIVISARAGEDDSFGSNPYIPYERFEEIHRALAGDENIDGLAPQLAETASAVNTRTSLSEGRMRVVGVDPKLLDGFGSFKLISGGVVRLEDLAAGQAYINDRAAEELEAEAGDTLELYVGEEALTLIVQGVVKRGSLAGRDSTLLLPLDRAQRIFDRPGQINLIAVSNRGGASSGVELSEDVTKTLRVMFTDREVATRLKDLLNQEPVLTALEVEEASLKGTAKEEMAELLGELTKGELTDELVSLLGDADVVGRILDTLGQDELKEVEGQAISLFANLGEFRVFDIKHDLLEVADQAGSGVTAFFIFMALFSIAVGILLIFLIFVMLAAARRSEMGMARAVGAKRGHMVQMFLFEGTAYAVVAAAIGVMLGLGVSALIVTIINEVISRFQDADFRLVTHFELRSAVIAYCLGMAITFGTVAFSAYRVSRLNIVMAIRDLPEALIPSTEPPFMTRFVGLPKALVRPLIFLVRGVLLLVRRRFRRGLGYLALTVVWIVLFPTWIVDIIIALLRFVWPYFLRGWLTVLLAFPFLYWGMAIDRDAPFSAGVSLVILGTGLMGRKLLQRTSLRSDQVDRVAFTATALVMLTFWTFWRFFLSQLEKVAGEMSGDFDVMFVSGIFMVGAAVWALMYNADLLVKGLTRLTRRVGWLRPVMVTAVAYPMSAKFRTGLTLAMFALVIFTLMIMSVFTESFTSLFSDDPETVAGGWAVKGDVNFNTPVDDIRRAIAEDPKLDINDFEAIGGYTRVNIEAREIGAESQRWEPYAVRAADDEFMQAAQFQLKLIADGYGTTPEEVWQALMDQPNLGVIEGQILGTQANPEDSFIPFQLEKVRYDDETMSPIDIEVREPLTGEVVQVKVIAVLDRIHESFDDVAGMIISKETLDNAVPFPVPITTYHFRLAEGVDPEQAAKELEAAFLEHGMEATGLVALWEQATGAFRIFFSIFTGFMALGLVVGIAALGVISTRAVVERRQQIGVLRAIGYRRRMIQISFLLEFSFVALLGTAIGIILGLILSYNAISDIRAEEADQNLRWIVPWVQIIVIVVLTYTFSMVATFLPARQASRIYPAEALRYE